MHRLCFLCSVLVIVVCVSSVWGGKIREWEHFEDEATTYIVVGAAQDDSRFVAYSEKNGKGKKLVVNELTSVANFPAALNDKVASYSLGPKTQVTFFEHADFKGKSWTHQNNDNMAIIANVKNDEVGAISSLKLSEVVAKPTVSAPATPPSAAPTFAYKPPASAPTAPAPASTPFPAASKLAMGVCMPSNQCKFSPNGRFRTCMQNDGNIVLYDNTNKPLWASNTVRYDGPFKLCMQNDGNLVGYNAKNSSFWASGTNGKGQPPYETRIQDDGNVALYGPADKPPLWSALRK